MAGFWHSRVIRSTIGLPRWRARASPLASTSAGYTAPPTAVRAANPGGPSGGIPCSPRRLAAAAFALAALPAFAQEITLKVHHFWPPNAMPPSTLLVPWCDKIAKDSNNRLKCQIYPAMQLGGTPPQLIDQAKDGVADIVWTLPGYTAGRFPMMEVFELPFMSASAEATSQAAWEYYDKYARKEFPGIQMLVVNVHDNGYVHTREKQVKTMADFKGLKMRAPTRQTNKLLARARRDAGRDAAARARRRAVERRHRRLPAAVGSDPVDQGARAHEVRDPRPIRSRARSTPRCSRSR